MEIHPTYSFDDTWEDAGTRPLNGADPASEPQKASGNGPCLFLGPTGERCTRKAIDGSFCARHQPRRKASQALADAASVPSRAFAAVVTIGILLWPYIADAVREMIRWLGAR